SGCLRMTPVSSGLTVRCFVEDNSLCTRYYNVISWAGVSVGTYGSSDALYILAQALDADVFFFSSRRRHTRLVSDWSSDVCSSDLRRHRVRHVLLDRRELRHGRHLRERRLRRLPGRHLQGERRGLHRRQRVHLRQRSEERRVGKEGRSRWAPEQEEKKDSETEDGRG